MLEFISIGIFLFSFLCLGMPHGAVDHYVWFRLRGQKIRALGLMGFVAIYLIIAGIAFGFFLKLPVVCALGLLALTWAHWGEADWLYERWRGVRTSVWFAVWRGSLPMLAPFVFHAESYREVLEATVRVMDPAGADEVFVWVSYPVVAQGVAVLLGVLACANWLSLRGTGGVPFGRFLWEDTLLLAGLLFLPPLAGIGLYFMFWHSLRHIRLIGQLLGPPMLRSRKQIDWVVFYKMAAPFTLGGALLLAFIYFFKVSEGEHPSLIVGAYLVLIWSLTWPHAVLCNQIKKLNLAAG